MSANTLLLAASWPGSLHPNDRLLHHTCLPEPSYRYYRSDSAKSIRLALTNQKEQEALALSDLLAWFNVSYALHTYPGCNLEWDLLSNP